MRPSAPRFTESRSSANGGRAQYRRRCSRLTIDTQLGNKERDADARVNRKITVLSGEHVCGGSGVERASKPEPPHDAAPSRVRAALGVSSSHVAPATAISRRSTPEDAIQVDSEFTAT